MNTHLQGELVRVGTFLDEEVGKYREWALVACTAEQIDAPQMLPMNQPVTIIPTEELDMMQRNSDFWLAAEKSKNAEFEQDYLAIWREVKQPDLTVLESVRAMKAELAAAKEQARLGWDRAAENDRNYGQALAERDAARTELAQLQRDKSREGLQPC